MAEPLANPDNGTGDIVSDATGGAPVVTDNTEIKQVWPETWRQEMAGADPKELKRLERMNSPADVFKSYRELEKIKSSFAPPPKRPDENSTPEEIKAYRDHIGVPEDYKGYDLDFGDGTALGEEDLAQFESYLQFAHENNLPKDVVKSNLKFYMEDVAREKERLHTVNDEARVNGIADLKREWGGEYQGNINAIQSLFTEAPEGTMQSLMSARDANGLKFGNNPDNIRWLVNVAKAINPTASLLPVGANDAASIDSELDKLRTQMNSHDPVERNKYWKDPKAQERLLALTQAKERSRK